MTVTIIILVVAFLVIAGLFANMAFSKNATAKKQEKKQEQAVEKKEEKDDDIPEILKEVTMGNYLYEDAKLTEDEQLQADMVENISIEKESPKPFRVELGEELDDDFEPTTTRDILTAMDKEMELQEEQEIDVDQIESGNVEQDTATEIKKLSPKMKAILISNILNKKQD